VRGILLVLVLIAAVAYGLKLAYDYTQTRFYVGVQDGQVTIYKGIKEALGPLSFSRPYQTTDLNVSELSSYQLNLVERTITATDLEDARRILTLLENGARND
jgi:PPM family protein phosphatase